MLSNSFSSIDNEDHTFCGIMFPVKAKNNLPVDQLVILSVSVRGQLGPMTVWLSNRPHPRSDPHHFRVPLNAQGWTQIYSAFHEPSQEDYVKLDLSRNPVVLVPGETRLLYIHSQAPGDEAIVYDNSLETYRRRPRVEDPMIAIYSGKAHLSPTPFGQIPIWGWGNSFRDHREFCGKIEYGCVYRLWNPEIHYQFGPDFRNATETLLVLQRRPESPFSIIPDECIYYILNMCRWDWFEDKASDLKVQRRQRRNRLAREAAEHRHQQALAGMVYNNESAREDVEDMEDVVDDASDSNMDDEDAETDPDDEDQGEDESDDDDEAIEWERENGYRADNTNFLFDYASSDDETDTDTRLRLDGPAIVRQLLQRLVHVHNVAHSDNEE